MYVYMYVCKSVCTGHEIISLLCAGQEIVSFILTKKSSAADLLF